MNHRSTSFRMILISIMISSTSLILNAQEKKDEVTLWFKNPASEWNEALPVGNGRLGAMVFGGVQSERLQLNEESIWSKGGQLEDNQDAYKHIPEIRRLLFEGKYLEADQMCKDEILGDDLKIKIN